MESRLPSSLPVFRGSGVTDPDAFIEQLSNNLLAHDVSASRWTSALLLGCAEPADASFVRESLLSLEWDEARQLFLSRFRDPLYFHRLQTEFYTMRKPPAENMLSYSARFERMAHKLDLKDSPSLVPLYIASLPNPLATQLQLYSLSTPGVALPAMIQTAISMDKTAGISSYKLQSNSHEESPATNQRLHCSRHGWGKHSTSQCSVLFRYTSNISLPTYNLPTSQPANHRLPCQ